MNTLYYFVSVYDYHFKTFTDNIQTDAFTINCNVFLELNSLEFKSAESINASALRQNNVNVRKDK